MEKSEPTIENSSPPLADGDDVGAGEPSPSQPPDYLVEFHLPPNQVGLLGLPITVVFRVWDGQAVLESPDEVSHTGDCADNDTSSSSKPFSQQGNLLYALGWFASGPELLSNGKRLRDMESCDPEQTDSGAVPHFHFDFGLSIFTVLRSTPELPSDGFAQFCNDIAESQILGSDWTWRMLVILGSKLLNSHGCSGGDDKLEFAIHCSRRALEIRSSPEENHHGYLACLSNLAFALEARYEQFGDLQDLDEAIRVQREALFLCPSGHPDREVFLVNLATSLSTKYERFGTTEDLEEAMTLRQEALSVCPLGHAERALSLNSLANSVAAKYDLFGSIKDLEETIALRREALSLCPPGHLDRAMSLDNLSISVSKRYHRFDNIKDLEEATQLQREALSLRPPGNPDHTISLVNLAISMSTRYQRLSIIDDLEEATALRRQALALRPIGHPDRASALTGVANSVWTRYERFKNIEDLEESTILRHQALSLRPLGHPGRAGSMEDLAVSISGKYDRFGSVKDLEDAVVLLREALSLRPVGDPERARSLSDLARTLLKVVSSQAVNPPLCPTSIVDIESLVREALSEPSGSIQQKLSTAQTHAASRIHTDDFRVTAYRQGVTLLQRLSIIDPDLAFQQSQLKTAQHLVGDAAGFMLGCGQPEPAIVALDTGRSIILQVVQQYRSPLDDLCFDDAELADEFRSLSAQLERLVTSNSFAPPAEPGHHSQRDFRMSQQRILRNKWDDLLGQIRRIPKFETFLGDPTFSSLQVSASCGPVILLNACAARCDGVVIFPVGPPELVSFSHVVSLESIREQSRILVGSRELRSASLRQEALLKVLNFLWLHVVSQIQRCLASKGVTSGRVWWCPSSAFSLLPLHAAGLYTGESDLNFSDQYISSYIPTLSELIRVRTTKANAMSSAKPPVPASLLFIGNDGASSSNEGPLDMVGEDLEAVHRSGITLSSLLGKQARIESVLKALQDHPWAHMSCHGLVNPDEPTKSYFHLEGERLSVQDIMRARLDNAELAFLAACHTAAPGPQLPDEGIHLASAMMFAGFRSVVGTMWEMYDSDGPVMARRFYRNLLKLGGRHTHAAEALHLAIRTVRRKNVGPERWAMFIHIGA